MAFSTSTILSPKPFFLTSNYWSRMRCPERMIPADSEAHRYSLPPCLLPIVIFLTSHQAITTNTHHWQNKLIRAINFVTLTKFVMFTEQEFQIFHVIKEKVLINVSYIYPRPNVYLPLTKKCTKYCCRRSQRGCK